MGGKTGQPSLVEDGVGFDGQRFSFKRFSRRSISIRPQLAAPLSRQIIGQAHC